MALIFIERLADQLVDSIAFRQSLIHSKMQDRHIAQAQSSAQTAAQQSHCTIEDFDRLSDICFQSQPADFDVRVTKIRRHVNIGHGHTS